MWIFINVIKNTLLHLTHSLFFNYPIFYDYKSIANCIFLMRYVYFITIKIFFCPKIFYYNFFYKYSDWKKVNNYHIWIKTMLAIFIVFFLLPNDLKFYLLNFNLVLLCVNIEERKGDDFKTFLSPACTLRISVNGFLMTIVKQLLLQRS